MPRVSAWENGRMAWEDGRMACDLAPRPWEDGRMAGDLAPRPWEDGRMAGDLAPRACDLAPSVCDLAPRPWEDGRVAGDLAPSVCDLAPRRRGTRNSAWRAFPRVARRSAFRGTALYGTGRYGKSLCAGNRAETGRLPAAPALEPHGTLRVDVRVDACIDAWRWPRGARRRFRGRRAGCTLDAVALGSNAFADAFAESSAGACGVVRAGTAAGASGSDAFAALASVHASTSCVARRHREASASPACATQSARRRRHGSARGGSKLRDGPRIPRVT